MLIGDQRPRVSSVPPYSASSGQEAVELAAFAGLHLDDWQQYVLRESLGERPDGSWSAFEIGLCVARQNGKTELFVARQLAGLFLLGEELIIHSAHQFDTATECFRRLVQVIESTPDLAKRVKLNRGKVGQWSHGNEGIELKDGRRIRFKARSGGAGRGFTCDCLLLDEAMILNDNFIGSVMPTLSARPNPQVWYAGSAGNDADPSHDALVFARLRERGIKGKDPSLAWFEWSVDRSEYMSKPTIADEPIHWAQANPALGIRISVDYIAKERRGMVEDKFCVERLGIGNWPKTDASADRLIQPDEWQACFDQASKMIPGSMVLAFDSTPDHSMGCLAVAGKRSDGRDHIELVKYKRDNVWIPDLIAQLVKDYRISTVIVDSMGPATALLPELVRRNIEYLPISRAELAQGCGLFFDGVKNATLRHGGQAPLTLAIDGVGIAPRSDAWIWSRPKSAGDICPLVAVTMALWGVHTQGAKRLDVINLSQVADKQAALAPQVERGVGPFGNRTVSLEEMAHTGW